MLQGSIIDPILFDIFLNELLLWPKNLDLHNFADDNTIAVTFNNLTSLCQTLERESESAKGCFKNNSMIANPGKFQAKILSKDATDVTHKLRTNNNEMENKRSVKLLRNCQIKFNEHISTLCSKATMQLNIIYSLQR